MDLDSSRGHQYAVKVTKKDPNSGNKNGYVITGSKRCIGNALTLEVFVVWARNTSLPKNPVSITYYTRDLITY